MITIQIANLHPYLLIHEGKVCTFLNRIISHYNWTSSGALSLAFMTKNDHSKLHGKFLNDFRPTDVITFPGDPENDLAGEICVSVDQAVEMTKVSKLTFDQELSLYLIHGLLHLIGYDDQNTNDRKVMKQEEVISMALVEKSSLWPDFHLASNSHTN